MSTPEIEHATAPAFQVAGRLGVTLLCIYLLAVTYRIGGCYVPDPRPRDDAAGRGPAVGQPFPEFTLPDVTGVRVSRTPIPGAPTVLLLVPSLDWSPPSKARVLDLAEALAGRRDVAVAVVSTKAQAGPRALAFVREHRTPFYYLVDGSGVMAQLGLGIQAPDGSAALLPATFVLDADGVVRLRDVRASPRSWLGAEAVAAAVDRLTPAAVGADQEPQGPPRKSIDAVTRNPGAS